MIVNRFNLATREATQLDWITAMRFICWLTGKNISEVWSALERGHVIQKGNLVFGL